MRQAREVSVRFDKSRCDMNPFCPVTRACPKGAMYVDRRTFRPTFDKDKCTGCAICVSSCPHGAMVED